jgi:hypothetical protein
VNLTIVIAGVVIMLLAYVIYRSRVTGHLSILYPGRQPKTITMMGNELTIALFATVIVGSIVIFLSSFDEASEVPLLQANELAMEEHLATRLGQFLKAAAPNAPECVLVIDRAPQNHAKAYDELRMEAFKAAFGEETDVYAIYTDENITVGELEADQATNYLFTSEDLSKIFKDNPFCTVIISMIGLPADFKGSPAEERVLNNDLLLAVVTGNPYNLGTSISDGAVDLCVVPKPGLKEFSMLNEEATSEEAVNTRYLLITPENVMRIAKRNSDLFNEAFRPKMRIKL